jgi:hypothetical protein
VIQWKTFSASRFARSAGVSSAAGAEVAGVPGVTNWAVAGAKGAQPATTITSWRNLPDAGARRQTRNIKVSPNVLVVTNEPGDFGASTVSRRTTSPGHKGIAPDL